MDSLNIRCTLNVLNKEIDYFSLVLAQHRGIGQINRLPYNIKILVENLLRHEDGKRIHVDHIRSLISSFNQPQKPGESLQEIAFMPSRVLMQDFTGVPAVVDLAAMRDAMKQLKGNASLINPLVPVDLVIDHSIMANAHGTADAFNHNVRIEFEQNAERYAFLKWGQKAFENFRVVPPGTGICHQVNLEYLAKVVWQSMDTNGRNLAYPDTVVGTDSHTTMINALSVLGWGVGGIEAEAAMLGQAVSLLVPDVLGFKVTGRLPEGITATDLVLTVTNMLRAKGVVGKFVEFYGSGLDSLSIADRATIANMAPEYGATCGFFPTDQETLDYLEFTGRDAENIALVELYAKAQGLWRDASTPDPLFRETLTLDLNSIRPTIAGPKRPQDKVLLEDASISCQAMLVAENRKPAEAYPVTGYPYALHHGDIVIAAITSCTNTSNPSVMVAAGLLARKAQAKGLMPKPWVKTSLAPGSQVVTSYLDRSGLSKDLDALGFNLVGYGCTTCIGNSGPLLPAIADCIEASDLTVCAILSGNRNFEGRINPHVKANYLASPPLVVAYALAGTMLADLTTAPLGTGADAMPVYLKDIWPANAEIQEIIRHCLTPEMFRERYADVFKGPEAWAQIETTESLTYSWNRESAYIKHPPFFDSITAAISRPPEIMDARILAVLGDSVTTDHISPAGNIPGDSPAGRYLQEGGIAPSHFNSYGARRGNHEAMVRGTFANIRLTNEMVAGTAGGITKYYPKDKNLAPKILPIYEACVNYRQDGTPLVIIAGKEYGTGSSRDWAAKGPLLLGIKAVIAESFERIHRSNLVGMGILPLTFMEGESRKTWNIKGDEIIDIIGMEEGVKPNMKIWCRVRRPDSFVTVYSLLSRIDTHEEVEYFRNGGILPYVLRKISRGGG